MNISSYHIFYFPFKWDMPEKCADLFSAQVNIESIITQPYSLWNRVQIDDDEIKNSITKSELIEQEELFGERQYFHEFVHPVLYDIKGMKNPIIHHYERREPKEKKVEYHIETGDKTYVLKVDAINLNVYSTGVGILSFYLANEREEQWSESCIRDINQFGRRIMPPHCGEFNADKRSMLARSISICGLQGDKERYTDCFDYCSANSENKRGLKDIWKPAYFIENLIADLFVNLKVTPVIDDRMLVNCWYGNVKLSKEVKEAGKDIDASFLSGNFWYKYVFIDDGTDDTCQNEEMKKKLLKESTYFRWQRYGTLYGVSRYSLVVLTDDNDWCRMGIAMHMRTIYSRMFELIIIQRASMLRFSSEITKVSALVGGNNKQMAARIGSLYKEYIRFVNQIYFRNVTVQDQGIELYDMLLKQFYSNEQIKDLDGEIEELHQYITLLIDQKRNENGEWLNWIAAILLPATLIAGILGMNKFEELEGRIDFWGHLLFILIISVIVYHIIKKRRN